MEIFKESCYGSDYKNNQFFQEWHKAIKRDLETFKIILEQYEESVDKENLLRVIEYIQENILNSFEEDDMVILRSTPNYFLYSFYNNCADIPSYVLLSKDYKRILIGDEEMECFDDEEFNEDERYGIYHYNYFVLEDNKVKHYQEEKKEYTDKYTRVFESCLFTNNIDEIEQYFDFILNQHKSCKKLTKSKKGE